MNQLQRTLLALGATAMMWGLIQPHTAAQTPKSQVIALAFVEQPERPGLTSVYRDAARVLFEGFKPAFRDALVKGMRGFVDKKYSISVELLARTNSLDPQYLAVYLKDDTMGTQRKEVYRFQITLQTDLSAEASAAIAKLAEIIRPSANGPAKRAATTTCDTGCYASIRSRDRPRHARNRCQQLFGKVLADPRSARPFYALP